MWKNILKSVVSTLAFVTLLWLLRDFGDLCVKTKDPILNVFMLNTLHIFILPPLFAVAYSCTLLKLLKNQKYGYIIILVTASIVAVLFGGLAAAVIGNIETQGYLYGLFSTMADVGLLTILLTLIFKQLHRIKNKNQIQVEIISKVQSNTSVHMIWSALNKSLICFLALIGSYWLTSFLLNTENIFLDTVLTTLWWIISPAYSYALLRLLVNKNSNWILIMLVNGTLLLVLSGIIQMASTIPVLYYNPSNILFLSYLMLYSLPMRITGLMTIVLSFIFKHMTSDNSKEYFKKIREIAYKSFLSFVGLCLASWMVAVLLEFTLTFRGGLWFPINSFILNDLLPFLLFVCYAYIMFLIFRCNKKRYTIMVLNAAFIFIFSMFFLVFLLISIDLGIILGSIGFPAIMFALMFKSLEQGKKIISLPNKSKNKVVNGLVIIIKSLLCFILLVFLTYFDPKFGRLHFDILELSIFELILHQIYPGLAIILYAYVLYRLVRKHVNKQRIMIINAFILIAIWVIRLYGIDILSFVTVLPFQFLNFANAGLLTIILSFIFKSVEKHGLAKGIIPLPDANEQESIEPIA